MNQETQQTGSPKKLYSQAAIGLATFLGAPLAAGILIRHNYIVLDEKIKGNISLLLGIISTIVIFAGLYYVPENSIEYVPNQLIPLVYTGLIFLIVERLQGQALKQHKDDGLLFYSNWRAVGIGFLSILILMIPIGGLLYKDINNPVYLEYNKEFMKFQKNEDKANAIYDHLETNSNFQLLQEIKNSTIPYWKKNLKIIQSLDTLEDITSDLIERNEELRAYCNLRIEELELMHEEIKYGSSPFSNTVDSLRLLIDQKINQLNE